VKFSDLSPEERAEVDALVHEAYTRPDGSIRTHAEAVVEFDRSIAGAGQAHREWAGLLLDDWRYSGMRDFLKDRWKHSAMFEFIHRGKARRRTVNRGARQIDDNGKAWYTQIPLWDWTADQLREAIADAARQVAEHQANIALYRDMLALIEQTETFTFAAALEAVEKTWDEFLVERGGMAV